jgi:SNF2 family DNA or RNA helicase
MQNNVDELYSLLRFLHMRPLDDWAEFKEKISQPVKAGRPQRAIKRLHVRFRTFIPIHRSHRDIA